MHLIVTHRYQFLLTNADTDTLASKISDTDADTVVFTGHFLFGIGTYYMYTHHHSI